MKNIVLIGVPGAGKSTIGVILAKTLGMKFVDTDIVIQEQTGRLLQEIIDKDGYEAFLKREEDAILSLNGYHTVIATGGSAVYSNQAMEHLKSEGIIVYLNISCDEMVKRLNNIKTRGIVLIAGQSIRDLYNQRIPLYETYADIRIDCFDKDFESVVEEIVRKIQKSYHERQGSSH